MPNGFEGASLLASPTVRSQSFDWKTIVTNRNFTTARVSSFKYAPLVDFWDKLVTENIKIEVPNNDIRITQNVKTYAANNVATQVSGGGSSKKHINKTNVTLTKTEPTKVKALDKSGLEIKVKNEKKSQSLNRPQEQVYWIATVIEVKGYLARLRYEGYENDSSHDFWEYIFSKDIHGVGWCASNDKTLVPPRNVAERLDDWAMYLIKKLTGAKTLPPNFHDFITDSLNSRFKPGMKLEVVDKNRVSSVRVATVELTVGGRLLVSYDGADPAEAGFWCHEKSPLVHPVGWAQFIQHELVATHEYARESFDKVTGKIKYAETDAIWDMFDHPKTGAPKEEMFEDNMKLEAIDPLNLSTICVATVIKVLRGNYLMIGIDGSMCPNGSDWFCYHATSPYIFPAGFCKANDLELSNPKQQSNFDWSSYLLETQSKAAPASLFTLSIPSHGFKTGMMIEAADLMQSRLVCVATITRIVGRLLRIHFNGWEDSYDQWCDCESPDLFPLGWCELVKYPLEPPKTASPDKSQPELQTKRKKSSPKKKLPGSKKSKFKQPSN